MIFDPIVGAFVGAIGGSDVFMTLCTIPFLYTVGFVFYKICL